MEIVNKKRIKQFVLIIGTATALMTIVPLFLYFIKFGGEFSEEQAEWGTFGDYFGGIIGTLFNLIAVIFSLVSIYITLRIATRLHENEQKFNLENITRDKERFDKEIELIHKQNKPFPFLNVVRYKEKIEIELFNQGTGTLIVKKWKLICDDDEFKDFGSFLYKKIDFKKYEFTTISFRFNNVTNFVLAPATSKRLLQIIPIDEKTVFFDRFIKECKTNLGTAKISIDYQDIFENDNTYTYDF
jgi:uncharacterized membrane protein